jgi:hypothetical protein
MPQRGGAFGGAVAPGPLAPRPATAVVDEVLEPGWFPLETDDEVVPPTASMLLGADPAIPGSIDDTEPRF